MTDRKVIYHPCPECAKTMETVDDPEGARYVSACKHCGWHETRMYTDIEKIQVTNNMNKN